ncbi:uncharacterized protein Z518_11402 [Rhinocladiella mackenziei CBS 650.93]|uniref:CMP/dCMP-type deaminase domain-containing protein n=1 Tax=Rhinocladiella mackenziei CBS 650.93 TaxID=1442369 RepID=A0A0D2IRP4_9EURO|nr:uncharacterized protein Z518_11402 [Rhinocladiella mackenziei CBS 650.93]KIW99414.1 hypothetical protein Z518_11402 [Rhinocladiella mackenziei CBS 650.93]
MADRIPFLEPLKTIHETRATEDFVKAFVVEIPIKLTSKALSIVKPVIPSGGQHPSFSHLRRVCTLSHLPLDLTWRRDYDSGVLQTVFLILPNTGVPWEDIQAILMPHIDVEGLPRCFDAVVPRLAPLSAEQATLWTERYWPSIFNPSSQVIQDAPPLDQLRRVRTALEVRGADKYMKLAIRTAVESEEGGHGRSVGAVVVDPDAGAVVAVAGDARWWSDDSEVHESLMASHGEGRPEYHAVMRVIAMVANKELRRRIKNGSHHNFLATCSETPSGQALTTIEARYEDENKVLRDLAAGPGNVALDEGDGLPKKQSESRPDAYLCNGLDLYLTHEPCVCCAMAMIHSRFRACVFARRMPASGGLCAEAGGQKPGYGLFWRRELNWRVMTFQHNQASALGVGNRIDTGIFHA